MTEKKLILCILLISNEYKTRLEAQKKPMSSLENTGLKDKNLCTEKLFEQRGKQVVAVDLANFTARAGIGGDIGGVF